LFEKFLSANVDSFRQRYEGTYGFYRDEKKKRLLVRLDSINAEECTFVNADGIDFRLRVDTARDIGFEFLPPKSAWYNTEAGAVWTQRLAQRQFSRGVTSKNLEISLLTPDRGLTPMRVDFKTLSSIYEKALAPALAIEALGKKSVAISSAFALDQSGVVYLFKEVIGSYKQQDKRLVFKLNEPKNWRTEISDACMAIGFTAEIS
jgi:hypothetical protein